MTSVTLSPPEAQFVEAFLGAATAVRRRVSTDLARQHNITLSEYEALRHLADATDHRMRLQDLASALALSRSRISRMIEGFEREGLIERERPADDRRGWYAILTPTGHDWLDRCERTFVWSVHRHALTALDPDTIQIITAAARRLTLPAHKDASAPPRQEARL
ncbi:MarR family winged helix-turn-helix transcriptional regulator [Paractinoplanes hotanensis]|uniref:MarR family transcriptional regulator n=1 Tax=Paractinoplanes hotanensis TaxID=2906497 RepID=A0ABT0YBY6_9ACTN|nr:MarR family transcriptional regulator [Actinoplanes hotanensis]MCM4083573.1 MarR family transcriptional regulator [Actinoplanes hotanensis]